MEQLEDIVVGKVDQFEDGKMVECPVGTEAVLVIREGNQFSAVGAKCTHFKQSLVKGVYNKGRIRCPLHGACFSTQTGDIEDHPGCDSLPVFPVRVQDGQVIIQSNQELLRRSARTKNMSTTTTNDKIDERLFLIIGGGPAGGAAAETLRAEGFTGRIIMVNKENSIPYDRTKFSKAMSTAIDKVYLRSEEFYKTNSIQLLLGTEVTELDVDTKTATLSNGDLIKYDRALIATGADCQRLAFIPGHNASNVHLLRTAADANRIWNRCEGKNVFIVGSSFIGMEVASCLAERSKVTVVGMENVPFERVLGKEVGSIMQKFHETKGIKFIQSVICREFKTTDGKVTSVLLNNGTEINGVDEVIIGAGVAPSTSFVKASPRITFGRDKSIVVDKHLYTGADGVWAAGDLCRYPFSLTGSEQNEPIRIEHFGMAQNQGVIAAKNMASPSGAVAECSNVPFFWTVHYGKSVRYCGHALQFSEVILDKVDADPQSAKFGFVAYYIHNNRVDAVCTLGRDPIAAEVAELFHNKISLDRDELFQSIKEHGCADDYIKSKRGGGSK